MTPETSWKDYRDFVLKIEPAGEGKYRVEAQGPTGEAASTFAFPFDEKDLRIFLLEVGRPRQSFSRGRVPEPMKQTVDFGARLFDAVMNGEVRDIYVSARLHAENQAGGLRIRLRLSEAPELANLPWEYLYDGRDFLALSTGSPLVRYLDLPNPPRPMSVDLPLRMLVTISAPHDQPPLDVEAERRNIEEALAGLVQDRRLELAFTEDATLRTLQRTLRRAKVQGRPFHIWHYIGHGVYDPDRKTSYLLFCDDSQMSYSVNGFQLGTLMNNFPEMRLGLLNACEGARTDQEDPFAGVATALVEHGVPAVVGMQFEISDQAAIAFAGEFYTALVDGLPVDAALTEARRAVFFLPNWVEWATPVLYMRSRDGQLFDVHVEEPVKTHTERDPQEARPIPPVEAALETEQPVEEAVEETRVPEEEPLPEQEVTPAPAPAQPPPEAGVPVEEADRRAPAVRERDRQPDDQIRQAGREGFLRTLPSWAIPASGVGVLVLLVVLFFAFRGRGPATATPPATEPGVVVTTTMEPTDITALEVTPSPESRPTETEPVVEPTTAPLIALNPGNAQQMVEVARLGRGTITQIRLSPDGDRLAVAGGLGLWTVPVNDPGAPRFFEGHTDWVRSVDWSPDGERLVSGGDDETVRVWDANTGTLQRTLTGHSRRVRSVAWSPDGSRLASSGNDGEVRIWSLNATQALQVIDSGANTVWSVAWSPNGNALAWGGMNGVVRVHTLSGANQGDTRSLSGLSDNVWSVLWSADGTRLIADNGDRVLVWQVSSGNTVQELDSQSDWMPALSSPPAGTPLSWRLVDTVIQVREAISGQELAALEGFSDWVNDVAWSPDGSLVAGGTLDGLVKVWNPYEGTERMVAASVSAVNAVAWSADGGSLITAAEQGRLARWDVPGGSVAAEASAGNGETEAMAYHPDEDVLAYAGNSGTVWVHQAGFDAPRTAFTGHQGVVTSLALSPNGSRLASTGTGTTILVWDTSTGSVLQTLSGHTDTVSDLSWANEELLLSGSLDGTLRIWDTSNGVARQHLDTGHPVETVAWSPIGTLLASSWSDGDDGFIQIWDPSLRELRTLSRLNSDVTGLAWSPDGTRLASSSREGAVRIWGIP